MTWNPYYRGDGVVREDTRLPDPPPWRSFPRASAAEVFQPPEGLVDAVNASLALRRPLLITGSPGTGKSTVIEQVAEELALGPVLRWHVTSRSTLADALYRYDALGRIHAHQLRQEKRRGGDPDSGEDDIAAFMTLGPLGTALLPSPRPRALLIDEIDKADLDLPGDLLDVLERGEYRVEELLREGQETARLRLWGGDTTHVVERGRVQCTEFPFIVMTSNGEQELPAPFLRRCLRYTMPRPTPALVREVVRRHLRLDVPEGGPLAALIDDFVRRVAAGESVAIDQLLSTLHLLDGPARLEEPERGRLISLLMKDLAGA
ncbi:MULTISPECIES: AAA family ATPase [unclassified Streptomyces]|uniref:AAA family ATPase n=1 Tax=unclassified Streptomyces TaxID=2593676 RepID=UPI00081D9F9A|nr:MULTISPECIES: AAA family ATPase [unclassified Streptomyces]MYZ35627.1 AAA domain-containing protein [Streptomyces sp. SID4917]SCF77028.1 AAA domain (dynein-related subfamily) [Streptomyces sp. MnatMP-M17]